MATSEAHTRKQRPAPTYANAWIFWLKANILRGHRFLTELGRRPVRLHHADPESFVVAHSEHRSPLWSDQRPSERALQWGKVQNLRAAAQRLDGILIPKGALFSFWRQLGPTTTARGFVPGRMLQEGCLVPAVGGGICQLSNALYETALEARCKIVERHAHSHRVPGALAPLGRDATVAWNYVDLRFVAPVPLLLRVNLTSDNLVVSLLSTEPTEMLLPEDHLGDSNQEIASSCANCAETTCFRHEAVAVSRPGPTAFLVDEAWPEFQAHVGATRKDGDILGRPLLLKSNHRWDPKGFARCETATLATLARSFRQRMAKDGPQRRIAEIDGARSLARRLGRLLSPEVTEVVVAQSLLPHLWRAGYLGGRRFSVLMTRLPMQQLQERLNQAAAVDPQKLTLSDFRADRDLVQAETQALAAAERLISPHTEIIGLYDNRAVGLEWHKTARPKIRPAARGRVAFAGPVLARKGAFELRAAAKALNLEIVLLGRDLEGRDFWQGIHTIPPDPDNWLKGVAAVVQPALLEDAPRWLLSALAAGVDVIATPACGLPAQEHLTIVPGGDLQALIKALQRFTLAL